MCAWTRARASILVLAGGHIVVQLYPSAIAYVALIPAR
jgi:hypothetical protein